MARKKKKASKNKWSLVLVVTMAFALLTFCKSILPESAPTNQVPTTTEHFIDIIGPKAKVVADQYDLYPSVMIAQSILESDSGQSALSQAPHFNFFGIKGEYNGQSASFETWEDDGQGNPYTIMANFRSYGSMENSLSDYAMFLQKDLYLGVRRSQTLSYQDATAALTGTYATDTSYGHKLNDLIARYQLTRFD